ncbi:MAG: iron-containing alcohol dehydrogenase [Planctomycetota bacterium]
MNRESKAAQLNTVWQFAISGSIKFGRGCRFQLAEEIQRRKLKRPLVVTDTTLLQLEIVSQLLEQLGDFVLFDGGVAEPSVAIAEAAISEAAIAAAGSGEVDCVVGIGGGSNLDVAKITANVLRNGGSAQDYFGFDNVPGPTLPVFALPTTSGTGSEVSHSAVLTDELAGVKVSTLSQWLRPSMAIVDPALTDSCPKRVTAESGIDALVHAVEAFTNRDFSEMSGVDPQARAYEGSYRLTKMLAAEAIRLVGQSLEMLIADPTPALRDDMALAATLAGMAFSNSGVGIVHALEYPIGALTHCGHGEGNGLLLPHVMRYNRGVREAEFAEIATLLLGDKQLKVDFNSAQMADFAIELVEVMQRRIGIRTQLRELGMSADAIQELAAKSFEIKRLMDINPRTPTQSDLEDILRAAY